MIAVYTIGDGAYVGVSKCPDNRWRQHLQRMRTGVRTRLYSSMRAHPEYRMRVLFWLPTRDLAFQAERLLIKLSRPRLNMTDGGDESPALHPEARAKIAVAAAKRTHPPETRAKIRAARARQTNVRAPAFDAVQREKMRIAATGRIPSEETRRRRSESLKLAYAEGRKLRVTGLPRDPKTGRILPKAEVR